jgi:glycosyltransferase involved in cell wall biosynthesis
VVRGSLKAIAGLGAQLRIRDSGLEEPGVAENDLPVHFFTIVLNGEPFIRYHLDVLRSLPFRWHWHVVEGVASLVRDTAWSVAGGGHLESSWHSDGLSIDGTTAYLDEIAAAEPERVTLYRKQAGRFWDGKREMVSAPLPRIREECLLWEIDADELWTGEQIDAVRNLFLEDPDRTAAYYWCDYFVAPEAVIATRYNYAANPAFEWLRTWRYRPGDRWHAHEPPVLLRSRRLRSINVAGANPFGHDETEAAGAVFQHFAYATEEQVRFKESYYGYAGAVEAWRGLREAVGSGAGPVLLRDHLPWVEDETLVDLAERRRVQPIARPSGRDGSWTFAPPTRQPRPQPTTDGPIVVDGVFFQDLNTGIARVWRSYFEEWLESGFARRLLFLDRVGAGPRFAGLTTRSVPLWDEEATGDDSLLLQRICDEEGAALFVSTYYTTPIATPTLMLVHDLIPERLGLDMSDPVFDEKRLTIEHADSYVCVSDNTRRDLQELEPGARGKPVTVIPLGVSATFRPAADGDIEAFRREHGLDLPYFLLVGDRRGVDGYKNTPLLFRALHRWSDGDRYEVVCVGGHELIEPELKLAGPNVRTRRLSLSDEELRLAYAGAVALVYPSRYEGFGLPVAEALACGCPVITTKRASLPDVAGDAALYIDPDDPQSLQEALDAVRNPERRAALVAAGLARAPAFRWDSAATAFAAALSEAAAAETAERRTARETAWRGLREAQAASQRRHRRNRPPAVAALAAPSLRARLELRLASAAKAHLPPRAVLVLQAGKGWVRRRRADRRRSVVAP